MSEKKPWNYINIWEHFIVAESDTGVCIRMPDSSSLKGYEFWLGEIFFRPDNKVDKAAYICVPDDFEFTLKKFEHDEMGRRKQTDEIKIGTKQMIEEWKEVSKEVIKAHNEAVENYVFDRNKFNKKKEKNSKKRTATTESGKKILTEQLDEKLPFEKDDTDSDDDDDNSLVFDG